MRAVYIGKYFNEYSGDKLAVVSISMPILKRKKIKEELKSITRDQLSFDNITYDNVKVSYEMCRAFMKDSRMSANVLFVSKFWKAIYPIILFRLSCLEYYQYKQEPLRVYIPYNKSKRGLKTLNKMAAKRKLNICFEEIRFKESNFQQLAALMAGCVFYHNDENLYLANLGHAPQAQLTSYIYSTKKEKGKMQFSDFIL